jgi:hypothetical protein
MWEALVDLRFFNLQWIFPAVGWWGRQDAAQQPAQCQRLANHQNLKKMNAARAEPLLEGVGTRFTGPKCYQKGANKIQSSPGASRCSAQVSDNPLGQLGLRSLLRLLCTPSASLRRFEVNGLSETWRHQPHRVQRVLYLGGLHPKLSLCLILDSWYSLVNKHRPWK